MWGLLPAHPTHAGPASRHPSHNVSGTKLADAGARADCRNGGAGQRRECAERDESFIGSQATSVPTSCLGTACTSWIPCAQVLERLRAGAAVALVSDAGMPAVSDPGAGEPPGPCLGCALFRLRTQQQTLRRPLYSSGQPGASKRDLCAALIMGEASNNLCAALIAAATPINLCAGLIAAAAAAGLRVIPVPGPSAALAALVASGLPTAEFHFAGFLPPKAAARRQRLAQLAGASIRTCGYKSSIIACWWRCSRAACRSRSSTSRGSCRPRRPRGGSAWRSWPVRAYEHAYKFRVNVCWWRWSRRACKPRLCVLDCRAAAPGAAGPSAGFRVLLERTS